MTRSPPSPSETEVTAAEEYTPPESKRMFLSESSLINALLPVCSWVCSLFRRTSGAFTETTTLTVVKTPDTRDTSEGPLISCVEGSFTKPFRTANGTKASNVCFDVPDRRGNAFLSNLLNILWYQPVLRNHLRNDQVIQSLEPNPTLDVPVPGLPCGQTTLSLSRSFLLHLLLREG